VGTKLSVRLQVTGTAPTTVRAKVWRAGTTEPSVWQVQTTDSTSGLQKAGGLALATYISGSATNVPVTAAWSNLSAVPAATTTTLVAPNVAPTASAKVAVSDLTASFDGSGSVDPDGSVAQYLWSFGDGTTGTGVRPQHVYAAAGTYTATLTVKDLAGAAGTATVPVTVTAPNVAPVARLAVTPQDLKVTASAAASSDADGTIASYAWTFGDGSTATGATASHTYAAAGTYTVSLKVTDDDGATSTASSTVTAAAPRTSAFPGPDTTGVPAGKTLKIHYGDLYITTPGAVIDGLDIRGLVKVKASGVVIKNSIVRGKPLTGSMGLITNDLGAYSFTLEDSELRPTDESSYVNGIIGHNFTVRRTEIARVIDSVHITGSNVRVEDSWLHDNLFYAMDPSWNGPSHTDSIQIQAGSNHRFLRNRIEGAYSSAFQTTQDRGPISDVVIEGNFINGGGCSVNIAWGSKYAPIPGTALQIRGNTFGTDTRHTRCAVIAPSSTGATLVSNAFVDGKTVTISRGW
jgi:PKD repeat protein